MESQNISDFLNNEYSDSALYINYRSTPSYIDGLKNSARKVVYIIRKNKIKEQIKVSSMGSKVTDYACYLHGESGIQGSIVTMNQSYCGANNLPILKGVGNFGTRTFNNASSTRYIYTLPSKYFDELFKEADDANLDFQFFEGQEIEPLFYVPTLPLLLVNGCQGIGVGFASKILNRDIVNIINAIKGKLDGKRMWDGYFKPSWNGFRGSVEKITDTKWRVLGTAELIKKNKVHVTELPIPYTLNDYLAILRKLRDNGVIKSFNDNTDNDIYDFEVTLTEDEAKKDWNTIFNDLKLCNIITENLTCVDEKNMIREYESVKDIFNDYFDIKMRYLDKRIKSEIARLDKEANYLDEIYRFIMEVVNGKIKVSKMSKSVLEKTLTEKKYTFIEKLISMPIYSLTLDKAEEAKSKLEAKLKELENMKNETPKSLWLKDLDSLEKILKKEKFI